MLGSCGFGVMQSADQASLNAVMQHREAGLRREPNTGRQVTKTGNVVVALSVTVKWKGGTGKDSLLIHRLHLLMLYDFTNGRR